MTPASLWPAVACLFILAETALLFIRNRRRNRLLLVSRALGRLYLAGIVVWTILSPELNSARREHIHMALTAIFVVETLGHLTRWVEHRRATGGTHGA